MQTETFSLGQMEVPDALRQFFIDKFGTLRHAEFTKCNAPIDVWKRLLATLGTVSRMEKNVPYFDDPKRVVKEIMIKAALEKVVVKDCKLTDTNGKRYTLSVSYDREKGTGFIVDVAGSTELTAHLRSILETDQE